MGKKQGTYPHTWRSGPDEIDHWLYVSCQRARAQAWFRGEDWQITEQEYIDLWRKDDLYLYKGRGHGKMCIIRIDRSLPWRIDNVEIIERKKYHKRDAQRLHKEKHSV